jgi:hypothetical protein
VRLFSTIYIVGIVWGRDSARGVPFKWFGSVVVHVMLGASVIKGALDEQATGR